MKEGNGHIRNLFSELYDGNAGRIYAYIRRMLRSGHPHIDDIFQQTFVKFYEQLCNGADIENAPAYLLRIARNLCYNELTRRKPESSGLEEILVATDGLSYEQQELLTLVYKAMDRLPEDYKELFVLREQLGMSYDEIETITGLNNDTLRQRVSRAKRMLRTMLAPYRTDLEKQG